jgi:hypothetical protein
MIHDTNFIYSDPKHTKKDKHRENEAKKGIKRQILKEEG